MFLADSPKLLTFPLEYSWIKRIYVFLYSWYSLLKAELNNYGKMWVLERVTIFIILIWPSDKYLIMVYLMNNEYSSRWSYAFIAQMHLLLVFFLLVFFCQPCSMSMHPLFLLDFLWAMKLNRSQIFLLQSMLSNFFFHGFSRQTLSLSNKISDSSNYLCNCVAFFKL